VLAEARRGLFAGERSSGLTLSPPKLTARVSRIVAAKSAKPKGDAVAAKGEAS
jgi:hypothetical protein